MLDHTETTWDELVSAALLGSERGTRNGSLPRLANPRELLDLAAAQAVARRAGARLARVESPTSLELLTRPTPIPADPRPLISPAAALRLRSILDGYQKYLPEFLSAVRVANLRIPPVFFPELLDLTRNNAQIRANLILVLGEPGRWLAALNRNWAFFLKDPSECPPAPAPAPSRVPAPPVADFTAEARRLLARTKNSNDLYNLVMRQPGLWPEEGSRLLIEYVAAHRFTVVGPIDGAQPTARSSDWAIEQLQRTIGDHAPVHLHTMVGELIEEQERLGAGPVNPVVDLSEILGALAYRAAMHLELREDPAPPSIDDSPLSPPADPEGKHQ